jgi:hypothetical protein
VYGVARAPWERTRGVLCGAVAFFTLALGPYLQVSGLHMFPIGRRTYSIPLPYLLLHDLPIVNGARVPSRFAEVMMFCLIVLAGYGLSVMCAGLGTMGRRAIVVGALLVLTAFESLSVPYPVLSTKAPAVYVEIGADREPSTVLELPLQWAIVKYHYYQTIHEKRMVVGNPVRQRDIYTTYPSAPPLIPILKDPRLLLEGPPPRDVRLNAERLVAFFDIRYVIIHREYLTSRLFHELDRFVQESFPHERRRVDGDMVAYTLRRPAAGAGPWPQDYEIDFGGGNRECVLLQGWASYERSGDRSYQWMDAALDANTV